ncbi:MAG TPA: helix-turn-helix domain-containing protein [Prolixibacteraceae bacterium]
MEPNSVKMRQESIEQLETRIINLNTQLNELVLQHQKRLAELNAQKFTMPDVMTAQEVAEYLKTSKVTVYDLIKKGKLKAFTLGENKVRVQREELEKYICNFRTIIVDKFAIL